MNMRYLKAIALFSAAVFFAGCSEKGGETPGGEDKPSNRSIAEIQFVSRLTDGTLVGTDGDFSSINDYMVNTLKGRKEASLTLLDRMDGAQVKKIMDLSVNTYRWNTFALNRMASASVYEGSAVFFNNPASSVASYSSGNGSYVCGLVPSVAGKYQKLDADGNVISSNDVTSDINFYTVRFSSEDQINAFGGASGTMMTIKQAARNMILIGTVKNSLFDKLSGAVTAADSAYNVKEIAKGKDYTIFMLSNSRFWNYYGYEEVPLAGDIVSYEISVGWK